MKQYHSHSLECRKAHYQNFLPRCANQYWQPQAEQLEAYIEISLHIQHGTWHYGTLTVMLYAAQNHRRSFRVSTSSWQRKFWNEREMYRRREPVTQEKTEEIN